MGLKGQNAAADLRFMLWSRQMHSILQGSLSNRHLSAWSQQTFPCTGSIRSLQITLQPRAQSRRKSDICLQQQTWPNRISSDEYSFHLCQLCIRKSQGQSAGANHQEMPGTSAQRGNHLHQRAISRRQAEHPVRFRKAEIPQGQAGVQGHSQEMGMPESKGIHPRLPLLQLCVGQRVRAHLQEMQSRGWDGVSARSKEYRRTIASDFFSQKKVNLCLSIIKLFQQFIQSNSSNSFYGHMGDFHNLFSNFLIGNCRYSRSWGMGSLCTDFDPVH